MFPSSVFYLTPFRSVGPIEKCSIPYYLKELFLTYNIEFFLKSIICQILGCQTAVQEEQSAQKQLLQYKEEAWWRV
jgi:hypothetical protein